MLSTKTTCKDSLEFNLACGSKYINKISNQLKELPHVVTKEELMNYYLHNMKAKGAMDTNVTIINLIQAANMAGVKVKGNSILEVNVSPKEQLWYITENINPREDKREIREKMLRNKNTIIKAYENGATIKELARFWNYSEVTIRKYLMEFGVKIRKAGTKKLTVNKIRDDRLFNRRKRVCMIKQ